MKLNQVIVPVSLLLSNSSVFAQMASPDAPGVETSARHKTLGTGAMAIENGKGGALLNPTNSVGKDVMIGGEFGYGSAEVSFDGNLPKMDLSNVNVQAYGLFPIMKMSGADNPLFIGTVLKSNTTEFDVKGFNAKSEISSASLLTGLGIDMLDFGLRLNVNNHSNRSETKGSDGLEISKSEYSTMFATFSAAAQFTKEIRVAVAFTPEMYKEVDDKETNASGSEKTKTRLIGNSTSLAVAGALKLKDITLSAGMQRIIPRTFEKNDQKEPDDGMTEISLGGEIHIDDFTPRAGLRYGRVQPDYAVKRLGFGSDWNVTKQVALTGDLAYLRTDFPYESEFKYDRTTEGYELSIGVNAQL